MVASGGAGVPGFASLYIPTSKTILLFITSKNFLIYLYFNHYFISNYFNYFLIITIYILSHTILLLFIIL